MNEVEYILRIVLKARDELAGALKKAREELRLFANAAESNQSKINAFNESIEKLSKNADNITDKFREWRAILQGTSDDTAKAKRSIDSLAKEVEETSKATRRQADAQEKAAASQDKLLKSADKLRNEYRKLQAQEKQSDEDRKFTLFRLKAIGQELEGLSKKVNDPDIRRFYFNWAQDSKRAADAIVADIERVEKERVRVAKEEENALKFAEKAMRDSFARRAKDAERYVNTYNKLISNSLLRQIEDEEKAAKESARVEKEASDRRIAIRKREDDAYKASVAQRAHLTRLTSGKADFIDIGRAKETVAELRRVSRQYEDTTKQSRRLRDDALRLEHALRNVGREGEKTGGVFSKLRGIFGGNSDSVATLDNKLRGLGLLIVVGFAQQLINVLGGLAGAFVAVGSSAAAAGTAIGGMFIAGIGQALPAIGLLGAALVRVKSVMDAVKQAQAAQQQGAVQEATAHRRVADAADTLREAQERLTKARKEARRDLQDLILAEREAELAAIGAALSQKEAQQALRDAIATGGDVQRAQLDLQEANARAEEAGEQRRRSRQDARRAQAGGVEGMPGVQQAQQQLETAKRNATEAAAGTETAVAKLNFLIAQLSPAEKRLYEAVTRFQGLFREGVYREITDNLVNSFARSVEKITKIIQMPDVINLAKRTSKTLASTLNNVFDSLTTKPMIDQLLRIGEAGRKNLKPLGDIATNVGKSLANIAEAAGPSFGRFLRFVERLVTQFEHLTGRRRSMEEFFDTGEKHLEAWVRLGVAIINFFLALAGAGGARSGLKTIQDATKAVDDLTEKIRDNGEKVGKFFDDSRDILYEVVGVVKALATELFQAWTPERIHDFADLLKKVIIPALGDVIEFLGNITQKIIEWADTPIGGQVIRFGVAILLVSKLVASTVGAFIEFARTLGFVFRPVIAAVEWLTGGEGLAGLATRLEKVFDFLKGGGGLRVVKGVGIVGIVLVLLDALGLLDDAWREVKSAFMEFYKQVEPSISDLFKSFKKLWDAVSEGQGLFGILLDVLRPVVKVIITIGGVFLRVFGRAIGRVLGGLIDALSGVIDFITAVFTGQWSDAWEAIKKIFRGIFRALTAPIRALPELIGELAKKILPALRDGVEALWDWLKKLPRRLGSLASDAADAFVGAFKNVGSDILNALMEGLKGAGSIAKDLANAFIDLLNWLIPDKIPTFGPDIPLPDNPIPHLASGGYIGGRYSQGDRYTVKVAGEEVILNPTQQEMVGREKIMSTLRSTGGQFLRPGGSYAGGARPQEGAAAGALTITFEGGGLQEFSVAWREFWEFLQLVARRGSTLVVAQFREMRNLASRAMDRMFRDIRGTLADLEKSFNARGDRIVTSWSNTWKSLMDVTHKALFYIGHETNQALRGLGESGVNFGFTEPPKNDGKAGGGFILGKGHRGEDRGFYPLGAGEAVLNWQHQRYVEPAMNAYYGHGLSTMFDRVHGYHAGGTEQRGFARGGIVPIPGMPGESISSNILGEVLNLIRRFKLFVYDGFATSGHATNSDHYWGGAIDVGPDFSKGGSWDLVDQLAHYAEPTQGSPRNPWRWVGYDGDPGHGRGNHLHLSWAKGAHLVGDFVTKVLKPIISGPEGGMKTIATSATEMVRKVANAYISAAFGATVEPGEVSAADLKNVGPLSSYNHIFQAGIDIGAAAVEKIANWAKLPTPMFTLIAKGESSFQPGALGHDPGGTLGYGLWQITTSYSDSDVAYANKGKIDYNQMFNPLKNALASKHKYEGASSKTPNTPGFPWYGTKFLQGKYAEGGEIPGPLGRAVPILAHAQEWIVNPIQQSRIAAMLGTSRDALKSILGFYGGGGSYQGGGEPGVQEIAPLTRAQARGIDDRRLRRLVLALRALDARFVGMLENVRPVGVFVERLDKMLDSTARLGRRLGRTRDESDRSRGVRAFLEGIESLTSEGGLFDKLRNQIELRSERVARRLQRRQFSVRNVRGRPVVTQVRDDVQIARADLRAERDAREDLRDEQAAIARSLAQVRRRQRQRGLTDRQRQRLQAQENDLRTRLGEASQRIVDNTSAIFDKQQALADAIEARQQAIIDALNTQVENINNAASRRLGRLDLAGRMLDALGRIGLGAIASVAGEPFSRAGIFAGRGAALRSQQKSLTAQLATARGTKGAEDLVTSLEDQLAELEVAIQENTKAYFDARVEDVNSRAGFALNINDLTKQLIELDGQIAGNTDQAALLLKSQERQTILIQQGNELSALLAETAPGTQQYQDLQVAILENSIAQRQNTIATNELTGATTEPQTFTSSAWTRFREAIFSGMGQVLPQYNPQNMMGEINTGAVIVPAGAVSSRVSGDTNINLYEVGRPVDLQEVSAAVTFASKTSQ